MSSTIVENQGSAESFSKDDAWAFRSKVYSILLVQLIFILATVVLFAVFESIHKYVVTRGEVFWLLLIGLLILMVCMFFCIDMLRIPPASHIHFIILTMTLCLFIAVGACRSDVIGSVLAISTAIIVVACLAVLAIQNTIEFSIGGGLLLLSVFLLFVCIAVSVLLPSRAFFMMGCYLGGIVLCLYLLFDIQLMIVGEHKYVFKPDEYLFASIMVYLDIFHIFTFILSCCGLIGNDSIDQ